MDNRQSLDYVEVTFKGNDVRPDTVKASEIADILIAVENMVESQVYKKHPELKKDQLILGFTNIESSSIGLQFRSPLPDIANSALQDVGQGIQKRDFSSLPSSSYRDINTIIAFTRKYHCAAELSLNNGERNLIAEITPELRIERPPALKAETLIYARVVRVGGKEPRVEIETVDGKTLFCAATRDITTRLGTKLYQVVGLIGVAEWDIDLDNIEQFSIKDVTDYEKVPFKEAIDELAKTTSPFYSNITNVTEYISKLRGLSNT